ncbi:MAG: hypothetical protein WBG46_08370 [Nonlabens sp.]
MKKWIVLFTALVTICATVYFFILNPSHREIAEESVDYSMSAVELHWQFVTDEKNATEIYLDKVLEVKGSITSMNAREYELNAKIQVMTMDSLSDLRKGQEASFKGRCIGYDELLEVVKIDQATLIKE